VQGGDMLSLQMAIYSYSLLVLLFLLLDSKRNKDFYSKTSIWFQRIIYATMIILLVEALTFAVDGKPGKGMYWVAFSSNSILFMLNLVPLSLWLVYLDECLLSNENEKRKKRIAYIIFNLLIVAVVVANLFSGILFRIAEDNHYIRGGAVYLIMAMNIVLFLGYLLTLAKYRKFISGRIYELILALGVFPILGATIQMLFYGTPLVWPMMALVALAAHILVEREEIRRDCLTGLLSRTQLESRAQYIVGRQQPFSLIMIDIDRFKSINDTYGHEEGDQALRIIANMLAKSIKQVDSAYRYAGDEFVIIIESEHSEAAHKVIERLESNLAKFNRSKQKPYTLSFSSGIAYYDGIENTTIISLIIAADGIMYQEKKRRYAEQL
jgi:diguanylate cyclase (GGDEF)-like protein